MADNQGFQEIVIWQGMVISEDQQWWKEFVMVSGADNVSEPSVVS